MPPRTVYCLDIQRYLEGQSATFVILLKHKSPMGTSILTKCLYQRIDLHLCHFQLLVGYRDIVSKRIRFRILFFSVGAQSLWIDSYLF